MVGILIQYKTNDSEAVQSTYMEGNNYEQVLKKFLSVKGGKEKVRVKSIQDWDRTRNVFTIPHPILADDPDGVVYQVINS